MAVNGIGTGPPVAVKSYTASYAGLSVYQPNRTRAQMKNLDKEIDDGDLATGVFREHENGYIYVIEF